MADVTPTSDPIPRDLGIFVSTSPVGFLEPCPDTVQQIRAYLTTVSKTIPRQMLNDLLVIKLLAPEASRDLVIYNLPMATAFLGQLRQQLVMAYYQEGETR
jgi:hypothetical protein